MAKKHSKADYFKSSRKNKMAATLLLTTGLVAASTMPALAADELPQADTNQNVEQNQNQMTVQSETTSSVTDETTGVVTDTTNTVYTPQTSTDANAKVPDNYSVPAETGTSTTGKITAGNITTETETEITKTPVTDADGNNIGIQTVETVKKTETDTTSWEEIYTADDAEYTEGAKKDENGNITQYLTGEGGSSSSTTETITTITTVETTIPGETVTETVQSESRENMPVESVTSDLTTIPDYASMSIRNDSNKQADNTWKYTDENGVVITEADGTDEDGNSIIIITKTEPATNTENGTPTVATEPVTITIAEGQTVQGTKTTTTTVISGETVTTIVYRVEQQAGHQVDATQAFLDSLAVTGNFVIYADTFNENCHIDGNIAVNELQTNVKEKNLDITSIAIGTSVECVTETTINNIVIPGGAIITRIEDQNWTPTFTCQYMTDEGEKTVTFSTYWASVSVENKTVEGLKPQGSSVEGLDNYSIIIDGNGLHYGYANNGAVIVSGGGLSAQLNDTSKLIDITDALNHATDKQQVVADAVKGACPDVDAGRVKQEADITNNLNAIAEAAALLNQAQTIDKSAAQQITALQNNGMQNGNVYQITTTLDSLKKDSQGNNLGIQNTLESLLSQLYNTDAKLIINVQGGDATRLVFDQPLNGKGNYDAKTANVIWNFGDYNGTIVYTQTTEGILVAPNATVNTFVMDGRVIARTVVQGGGQEIHQPHVGKEKIEEVGTVYRPISGTVETKRFETVQVEQTYTTPSTTKTETTATVTITQSKEENKWKQYTPVENSGEEPGTPENPEDTPGGGTTPDDGDTPDNNNTTTTIDDNPTPQGDAPADDPADDPQDEIDDDPVPLADAADDSVDNPQDNEEINDNPVPQARAFVQSGDNAQTAGFAGMLMAALAGLFATRRRMN